MSNPRDEYDEQIDHTRTHSIVCPWCGHEYMDSWEFRDIGEMNCNECGKRFSHERDIIYSTSKVDREIRGKQTKE